MENAIPVVKHIIYLNNSCTHETLTDENFQGLDYKY